MQSGRQNILCLSVFLLAQIGANKALAKVVNIEKLNQKLQTQNATWIAKDSWVNNLSPAEIRHAFGLQETPNADVEFTAPELQQAPLLNAKGGIEVLPLARDWRNFQDKNWISPILNQANCGSCVAFAAVGVLESQLNISSLIPNLNPKLSPQFLFGCGGGSCDLGWQPQFAARFLQKTGTPDEACLPYTSGATSENVACQAACGNSAARVQKISTFTNPTRGMKNIPAVKQALLQGPLMTTMTVYSDFVSYSSGVYKRTSSQVLGGHAVSIVGYDDNTQSWIIRNSWGEEWGEKGFAHIAYSDDSGISNATWLFAVPAVSGYTSTLAPRDYTYLSGTSPFSGTSSLQKTAGLKFNVYDREHKQIIEATCESAPCNASVDTKNLADGRYEVETVAVDSTGQTLGTSPREFFYVINSQPKLTLSFKGHEGLDLGKPLKGRIELDINSTAAPVPMSSLEFHIKNLSTGVELIRTSQVVLDTIVLGWRTTLVANGDYELWMVGKVSAENRENTSIETARIKVKIQN